jgi:hypothetical protein
MLLLRSIAMLLALMSVVPAAYAQTQVQEPNEPVTYFGLTFPTEIGGAPRINVRAYESDSPGGGYSAGYRHGEATSTVYIYDGRIPSIPDNLKSAVVRGHFEQAKASVGRLPQLNVSIKGKNAFSIRDKSKRERLICQAYVMTRQPDTSVFDTFVCLGVFKGKFLKVRTTMPRTANAESEVRRFVGLWVDRLWEPVPGRPVKSPRFRYALVD